MTVSAYILMKICWTRKSGIEGEAYEDEGRKRGNREGGGLIPK